MVQWQDRGFVGDSDDEEEFFDLEADRSNAAASLSQIQPVEEVSQQGTHGITKDGAGAQVASSREVHHADKSSPRSSFVDARSAQSTPANVHAIEHETPVTSPTVREADKNRTSNRSQPLLEIFDIPSSPLTELDTQSPIGPSTPHPDSASFPLSRVVVNIPQLDLEDAEQNVYEDIQADKDGVFRIENGGRAFRPRTAIQLHPYLLESEQYRRSLQARGLRPVTVSNQDSQAFGNTENIESQMQDILQQQGSQSSSFHASTPSVHRSVGNSPLLHPEDNDVDPELEFPDRLDLRENAREGALSVGHKRRKVSHPGEQVSRSDARRILESNPMFQLSPSPERSPSWPSKMHKKERTRRPKLHIPETNSPPPLPTPVTSSVRRKPWRVISDDESSNEESALHAEQDSKVLPIQEHRGENRTRSWSISSDGSQNSPEQEPYDKREKAEMAKYRKKLKGILPASWLRIDQQVKQPSAVGKRDHKHQQDLMDRATDRRGVARPLQKSYPRTPGSEKSHQTGYQEVIEVSDQSDGDPDPTPYHESDKPPSAARTQGQLSTIERVREVEEDNWIDPMLPSVSRPRKSSGVTRQRQTKLTDNFRSSTKPTVGRTDGQGSTTTVSHKRQGSNVPKRTNDKKRRPWSSQTRLPAISLLDVLESGSQDITERPDFLKVARRRARSTRQTGQQQPSRKQMYFRNRTDGHDVEKLLQAWRAGSIKPRLRVPSDIDLSTKQRAPLAEQQNNNQRSTPNNLRQDHVKPSRTTTGQLKTQERSNAAIQMPNLQQSVPNSTSEPLGSKRGERTQEDAAKSSKLRTERPVTFSRANLRDYERRGQLEELQAEEDHRHPQAAFRRNLLGLDTEPSTRSLDRTAAENPLLARYLDDTGFEESSKTIPSQSSVVKPKKAQRMLNTKSEQKSAASRHHKKRQPMRLDTDDFSLYRGPADATEVVDVLDSPSTVRSECLEGLASPGHFYPITFGACPLPHGTYFHRQSFVGSGELKALTELKNRNLDFEVGFATFSYRKSTYRWGPWTEDTSAQISALLAAIPKDFERLSSSNVLDVNDEADEIPSVLRAILRYFTLSLHFSDPVDRKHFVGRCFIFMLEFLEELSTMRNFQRTCVQQHIWMLGLSLWYAICEIRDHDCLLPLPSDLRKANEKAVIILRANVMAGFDGLQDSLGQQNIDAIRERGIPSGDPIDTWCAVIEILRQASLPELGFWDCFNQASNNRLPMDCSDARQFEALWKDMFQLLPVHQLHASTFVGKSSSHQHIENWALVKKLIVNVTNKYSRAGSEQPKINSYIRALEGRCFTLVKQWQWQRPEPALNCIFDFFAHRNLYLLNGEEPSNTSMLLDQINRGEHLQISPSDHSFTLFLKMLQSSLLNMCHTYTIKKMRNITWRFVPNHGRVYRKEEDLRRDDLEALRNHHDLLSLLYASSPPDARPKPTLIQNLVELKSSHSEVCRLHIKTWANLVKFQLSTDEAPLACEPFSHWFNSIMHDLIAQHRGARAEAEEMFQAANKVSVAVYSRKLVDRTVGSNERQIGALMSTLLSCLKDAIVQASNEASVRDLVEKVDFNQIFRLAEYNHARLGTVIGVAVEVVQCYFKRLQMQQARPEQQESNDDSQDYGAWPSDDEDEQNDGNQATSDPIVDGIAADVQQLLSNCFGADNFKDQALLEKLTRCWVSVATTLIQRKRHDWSYYLAMHSQGSWSQLRQTENRAKFYPLYLANVIDSDSSALVDNKSTFLGGWLVSLLERESLMRYQHILTMSLLNGIREEPLLYNLPFESHSGQEYSINLEELKGRRLSLISSVLSNMRHHLEQCMISESGVIVNKTRQSYAQVLEQMMSCMKKNYQALGTGSSLTGAYVEFVHSVVENLQQYTTEICSIDKFFTDSTAFPLPANDPFYVVGRIRSYGVKPNDPRNQKKLVVFLQTVIERAVADGEQDYLTDQLVTAMNSGSGSQKGLASLRQLFLESIVPAYFDLMHTECGCLLALPVLASLPAILRQHLFHHDLTDVSSLNKVSATIIRSILQGLERWQGVLDSYLDLKDWAVTHLVQAMRASVPLYDFVRRAERHDLQMRASDASSLPDLVFSRSDWKYHFSADSLVHFNIEEHPNELRTFAQRQLGETLCKNWAFDGTSFWVTQGNTRRSIPPIPPPPHATLMTLRQETEGVPGSKKPYASGAAKVDFIDNLIV